MRAVAIALALALAVLSFAGCGGTDGFDEDYPVRPGVGGTGGVGNPHLPDAAPPPDAGPTMSGRVCLIIDLRTWDDGCGTLTAAGLTVQIGADTTTTTMGGDFTFPTLPNGTEIVVTGGNAERSITPITTPNSLDAVAVTTAAWNEIQGGSSFAVTSGDGSLFVHLVADGGSADNATVASNPAPGPGANGQVLYDSQSGRATWGTVMTDIDGKALVADVPPGDVGIDATFGTRTASDTFTVEADSITFATLVIPP
jgi:hypothetical protein